MRELMDRFWGTEWETEIYEEVRTLFGPQTVRMKQSGKELGERFQKRLKKIFPHCTVPVLMTNSKNAPLYCLVFAGHNWTGVKIANDIFDKVCQDGLECQCWWSMSCSKALSCAMDRKARSMIADRLSHAGHGENVLLDLRCEAK